MAADPTDTDIAQICEVTFLDPVADRSVIVAAFKEKHGSIDAVVNEFYNDEAKFRSRHRWDEAMFAASRDGVDDSIPSFSIDPPSDNQVIHGVSPSQFHIPPPSRPPSRTQSPLGRLVNWTADAAAGGPASYQDREDEELRRAIAESCAASNIPTPQEIGVSTDDTSLPFFGPATRPEYSQNEWAMVPLNTGAAEPGPSGRKRHDGVPAFLRYRQTGTYQHRLGGLVTVLHAIPAARNALLATGESLETYGHHNEWYRGTMISSLPQLEQQASIVQAKVCHEMHRLMAFLDSTDRSYGTADTLANILYEQSTPPPSEIEKVFFDTFRDCNALEDGGFAPDALRMLTLIQPVENFKCGNDSEVTPVAFLDLAIPSPFDDHAIDLYDVLDIVLWTGADGDDASDEAFTGVMKHSGDVLTLRLALEDNKAVSHSFSLPEIWYGDRYLPDNVDHALKTVSQLRKLKGAIEKGDRMISDLALWQHPSTGDKAMDRLKLGEACIKMHQNRLLRLKAEALWRKHEEVKDTDSAFAYRPGLMDHKIELTEEEGRVVRHHEASIAIHKENISKMIRQRETLQGEVITCKKLWHAVKDSHKGPCPEAGWSPKLAYTLRGVVIDAHKVYVRKQADADLMDFEENTPREEQWWMLGYESTETDPIKAEKTTFEAVQQHFAQAAATSSPLVIYATPEAMKVDLRPLTEAQRKFVRFDNRLFKQELIEETPEAASAARDARKRASVGTPASPPKRLQRSASNDSMATNRASVGGDLSDRDDQDMMSVIGTPDLLGADVMGAEGGLPQQDLQALLRANNAVIPLEPAEDVNVVDDGTNAAVATTTLAGGNSEFEREERAVRDPSSTEMVQLPIRHNSSSNSTDNNMVVDGDMREEAPEVQRAGKAVRDAERRSKAASFIADWDHPEGKLVEE